MVANTFASFSVDTSVPESAAFQIPKILDSKTVLQQNTALMLWGNYPEEGPIAAEVNGVFYYGTCSDNRFEVIIKTGPASQGNTITLYSKTGKRTIRDVWFGEVFLCSGQSNMQVLLSDAEAPTPEEIANAGENLRIAQIPLSELEKPADHVYEETDSPWEDITHEKISHLSATGFYFGIKMQAELGVPVGIVVCAAGDTIIASWLSPEDAAKIPPVYQEERPLYWLRTASHMYRVMLYPILNFHFKGVVWYQGENQSQQYDEFLELLIKSWREYFKRPELGFVIIELVGCDLPWIYKWPEIRQKQRKACEAIPGCALSVGVDLGEEEDVHPKDKRAVGTRAAFAALNLWYQRNMPESPVLLSAEREGEQVVLRFSHSKGLKLLNHGAGFEVSPDGEEFFEARAKLDGERVLVSSDLVRNPTHIRYLWQNYPKPMVSVYSGQDLPADCFFAEIEASI